MILNYYAIVNNRPPAPRSENGSAGGGWGEECRAVRAWKPRRTAQKLLGRNRAEISLSFFEFFFRGRAQKKNCKGKFLRGCRRSVSGGGRRDGQFRSKNVRAELYNSTKRVESDNFSEFSLAFAKENFGKSDSNLSLVNDYNSIRTYFIKYS